MAAEGRRRRVGAPVSRERTLHMAIIVRCRYQNVVETTQQRRHQARAHMCHAAD